MPRKPSIRASYTNDANYLFRLVDAIERDTKRPVKWRKKLIAMTQALATEFIKAPGVPMESESEKRVS